MYIPTRVLFGAGQLNNLHTQKMPGKKAMVVISNGKLGGDSCMEDAKEPMDFITMLAKLQEDCGVADRKMSDYGIKPEEFDEMSKNARETMGGLFMCDRSPLSHKACVAIYEKSYR